MDTQLLVAECDVGRGVFAARAFRPGELILRFAGEPYDRHHPIHDRPEGANLLQVGPTSYILPGPVGLYVNHSCNPNAGLSGPDLLVAIKDIPEGAEVRFDYSTGMDEDLWTMKCACREPNCRGIVRDFKYLPPLLRRRYVAWGIVPDFIAHPHHVNGQSRRARG